MCHVTAALPALVSELVCRSVYRKLAAVGQIHTSRLISGLMECHVIFYLLLALSYTLFSDSHYIKLLQSEPSRLMEA